jgi:peptide/nickel transport system ATP-binding protein
VPDLYDEEMDDRCYFADRCPKAMEECLHKPPEFDTETGEARTDFHDRAASDHGAKCYLAQHDYDSSQALPEGYFETGEARSASESASGDAASENEEVSADD